MFCGSTVNVRSVNVSVESTSKLLFVSSVRFAVATSTSRSAPIPEAATRLTAAAVISVGTATLAAFIGAGGLGEPIVQGLSFNSPRMILSGAVPAAVLAMVVDTALGWLERRQLTGLTGGKVKA